MTEDEGEANSGIQVDADLVRRLAEMLTDNDLSEIEVQDGERRIVVKRQLMAAALAAAPAPGAASAPPPPPPPVDVPPAMNPDAVKSPMVGTVFLSGEPGASPFVTPGARVSEGDTLLIIEAMKVMNPITAARAGTVKQILVVDAQPVEFDQPLMIIE